MLNDKFFNISQLTRVDCALVEAQASGPDRQTAVPPGPALATSPGPIAAMVLLHTVEGLSTVSHLPEHKTPGITRNLNQSKHLNAF